MNTLGSKPQAQCTNGHLMTIENTLQRYSTNGTKNGRKCRQCTKEDPRIANHRAILCSECNHTIGRAKDSPELLRKMADYIESHTAGLGN